ncbi:spore germination protein GerPE [Paenibacillus sp. SYP-B3998]|uniref:Spore germination protein GerPE n=1 Tax=Paenibacillus sp. SYP-B3998 TaxID=2678564 RepID=A0A6G4A2Y8_9BACL|nr:spore germination protein GerPE [Paenibacillus sp. SYP-B3998]NEW08017.1 spore germination protein GerPE [Paenibacillus sp. SYP-B3998]
MARLSIVSTVYVNDVGSSSTLHIGDHVSTTLQSRAFAVQREVPLYYDNEGNFDEYPFYIRPFPIPQPPEPVAMSVDNWGSFIRVGGIRILGVASSSLIQIGSNCNTRSETRIKDFRQFVSPKPGPQEQTTFVKKGQEIGIGDFVDMLKPPPRPPHTRSSTSIN